MADPQLILELLFLHRRGGCSLTVSLILSASLCVVHPAYRAIIGTKIHRKHNFYSGRNAIFSSKW